MYCTKCGSLVQEGARFCKTCGQPLAVAATLTPEPFVSEPGPGPALLTSDSAAAAPLATPRIATYPSPIQTPSAIVLPAPYAGFWLRFVAYLIDAAIMGVV